MINIPTVIVPNINQLSTTILIVDDLETDRATYCRYINSDSNKNYHIVQAETLEQAIDIWQSQHIDVALVDFNLPDGDGLEFLEVIAQGYSGEKLPIIMLTGQGDEDIAVCVMKAGAMDYLVKKNITKVSLSQSIENVLNLVRLNRKLERLQKQESLIAGIALHIRESLHLDRVYQNIVEDVRLIVDADRTLIYKFHPDMNGEIVAESVIEPWQSCLHSQVSYGCCQDYLDKYYRQGKIFSTSDIYTANLKPLDLRLLEHFQVRATLVVPILVPNSKLDYQPENNLKNLWGLLVVHQCSSPRIWENADISLMQQLSVQLAIAIQQAELYKQLQNINTSLEDKLQERTQELQLSERRFEAIFNNSFQFTGLLTTTGIVLAVNQTALDFAGVQLETVINRPVWETTWWRNSLFNQEKLKQAIADAAQGEFIRYEVDILGANDEIATIDFSLRPLKEESGQVVMLIPEGRDITDKKRGERNLQQALTALQASESELRGLLNAMVDMIVVLDQHGRYLKIVSTKADNFYRPDQEVIGKTVHEVLPTHVADLAMRVIAETLATQQTLECEYSLKIDTKQVYFMAKVSPVSSETVIWVARDITRSKHSEIITQQTEKALAENQILLQVIMDSLPIAIFWKDRNSRYLGCNRQLLLDAGLSSPTEIIGKTDFDLPWKEQAPLYQADDRLVMESGQPKFGIEEPLTKHGNINRWLYTNRIPLRNLQGEVFAVVVSYQDITERKEMELALQASKRRYATLVTSAPVGIYRTDTEGNCLYVNHLWCETTGLTIQEALFTGWKQALHPEDQDLVTAHWDHLMQTGTIFSLEYRFVRPDGSQSWVFGQAVPESDDKGNVTGYVGTITNITRSKEAETALRDSEERFRQFAENSHGVMLLRQIDTGELLYVNPAYHHIWGQTTASLYENPDSWMNAVHPDDRPRIDALYQVNGEQMFLNEEYRIIRPDGRIRWIWGRCFPIIDGDGKIYRLAAIAEDITERKVTEEERDSLLAILEAQNQTLEAQVSQRTDELQESKERFRNLVETSSDWIWEINEEGIYTYSSPQIMNVLGYSPEEILGKSPFEFMPPLEAQRVSQEFMKFISVQAPFQCLENINRHQDGRLITLETSAVPFFDENGQFRGYRGMDRDITARKQAEIALRQNEARFQRIAANAPGVMYQYILYPDGSHEFTYISDRCRELFELEPDTILQDVNTLFNLVSPEDLPSLYESIAHSAHTLEQWSWERRIITPSGQMKWIQGISQPQKQANGDILWDGLILDISVRAQLEAERKQIEIALLNISDRLNLAINSAHIGIWDWDIVHNHLVWDDRMYELYEINPLDFRGISQAWVALLHPDDIVSVSTAIQQAIDGEKDFDLEFRVLYSDERIKFIKAYALIKRDEQGQPQRMIGINYDITNRKQEE
ncbi:MAG: PAS domain S-box protein [Cuspidothrix sp.]